MTDYIKRVADAVRDACRALYSPDDSWRDWDDKMIDVDLSVIIATVPKDAPGGSTMTKKAFSITGCRECGSTSLSWKTTIANPSSIQHGRLTTHDVVCKFFLGCDHCSETLSILDADDVAEFLNEARK